MTTDPESRLEFVKIARSVFQFLLDDPYRMTLDSVAEGAVRYVGHGVSVAVVHDRLSYELDVEVGRVVMPEERKEQFCLLDFMRVTDPALADAYRRFAATSVEAVRRGCNELADELRRYGSPALEGSDSFFGMVSAARSAAEQLFGERLHDSAARQKAQQAWSEEDFERAAAAYGSIIHPSRVDERRLKIARSRALKANDAGPE